MIIHFAALLLLLLLLTHSDCMQLALDDGNSTDSDTDTGHGPLALVLDRQPRANYNSTRDEILQTRRRALIGTEAVLTSWI